MSWFLLGLQYAAGAFMIVLIAIAGMVLLMKAVGLVYGNHLQPDEIGAPEGDARNFRLRSIDDDHYWDDI
ncbi:hypothetical protein [Rhizobium sp. 11515TR]|uniref:hypothetical protein n=1 Tax=Rhizobium sp. 11515TR TaxID=2028343 RepID=UPI000BA88C0A|nr:hypothetical protein [Rhizobium sp. 11515TR]ASW06276.1 hypothetical protein CKA34_10525 [Rhizobium sp. 11515TR]